VLDYQPDVTKPNIQTETENQEEEALGMKRKKALYSSAVPPAEF